MKIPYFFLAFSLLLLASTVLAQNNCNQLTTFNVGTQWTYQWYGANKKPSFKSIHEVITQIDSTSRIISITTTDAFSNKTYEGTYKIHCTDKGLKQDLLAKLTPSMLSALSGIDINTDDDGWLLPIGMNTGDTIPQAYSHIEGYNGSAKIVDLNLAIGPVTILDQEDLSTPAGGFSCVAVAYELWVTQVVRKSFRLRDWYAPHVGVIRRELFSKSGKYYGYCELIEWLPKT